MWTAVDWVFPVSCAGCDAPGTAWCETCNGNVGLHAVPTPIDGVAACLAVAPYDGGVGRALRRAKYGPDRRRMRLLASLFADHAAPVAYGFDAIVPVPSPWTRRMARGFSGAALLGEALAERTGVPLRSVLHLAPGARQAGLRAGLRAGNLGGRMRSTAPVRGRVLLVDDVFTTGVTVGTAARELLGDASDRVYVVVLTAAAAPHDQTSGTVHACLPPSPPVNIDRNAGPADAGVPKG